MKGNSNSKKTTEEKKNEKKMTNADLMQFLGKYDSIIKDKMISDNAKKVLSCLLYVGSKQNESFTIGQRTISDLTGVPKNKISANIAILVDKGFINCNVGERGKNSEYTINYEAMKLYVSLSVPSVPKCTEKVSQVSQSVPSVPNNEGTVNRIVEGTLKDTEIQRVMERIEVYQKCINEELGTLKKIFLGDINININNNINKNLKDNISNNNNTEGNNIKDQNKKKNISTGNLEKLKENSTVEIPNDEIIPSGMKDSSEDKDNISKVKSSSNENPDNENNIPSDEGNISGNENPKDYPPLDVDGFFEDSNSTEYRTNENLNEENETSRTDENSKEDENPSKANGSSKEDGGLSEDKNPSDENPKANENPEDDEISVFGDSNSTDEDKDNANDKWYESSRSTKSDNHANGMFTNLISELTSNNPKANEIPNDNNSKTSENMKKTNNKTNTIPSDAKNPSDENPKTNENLNAFGKLQSFRDMNTGRIDGYQFNSYDNLNDSRDYSKSFHASVLCLNLEPSDLKKVSASDTGTWGILNRTNGVYSFIPSNVGPSYAPNNALQGDEMTEVDNHTAEGEKVDSTQSPIVNTQSEDNNHTTADSKDNEKTEKTQSEDTPKTEIPSDGNETSNNTLQGDETSKVDNHTAEGEKVDSTQSQIANKASNAYADVLEDDAETIAIRERVMRQNAARAQQTEKKSDDKTPKALDYYRRTPDGWKEIPVFITMEQKKMTMGEALELYKNFDDPLIYIYSIMRYVQDFCEKMRTALRLKAITDEQFKAFNKELDVISAGYKAYWKKRFSYQRPSSSAEKDMHRWLGSPKVTQGKN